MCDLDPGMEICEGRYRIVKLLGSGSFGDIFYSVEKVKDGTFYMAKVERAKQNAKHIMLFWESKLMHKMKGKTFCPQVHYIGTDESKTFHVMIMD